MSKDKYSLEGKWVKLFLRGAWEFAGVVEYSGPDKIVLVSDLGSLVVYKQNIVAAMILSEKKMEETIDQMSPEPYNKGMRYGPQDTSSQSEDMFEEQHDQYGSVIPEDMLEGSPEEQIPVSFTVNMADLKNPKTPEEKYGSRKETKNYREEG